MSKMRESEAAAKRVLEAVFPGAEMCFHQEQSHGECDFDLWYADGAKAAVEVTEAANQEQRETWAAIHGERAGGSTFKARLCKRSWLIVLSAGADVRRVRGNADSMLSNLESEGIDEFSAYSPRLCEDTIGTERRIVTELSIVMGRIIDWEEGPTIHMQQGPLYGGPIGPTLATGAAESKAREPDNRKKLGAVGTSERHLVVYVDPRDVPAHAALTMRMFKPLDAYPKLPDEITHLWIIGPVDNNREFIVWRGDRGHKWQRERVSICKSDVSG